MSDAFSATEDLNPVNDFLDLADLNKEGIQRLLNNAYMDTSTDDTSVYVNERRGCWITPSAEYKRICLAKYYTFQASATEADKLAYVNKINDVLPIIRAYVSASTGNLALDWYLPVDGGVTRRWIVYAIKRFIGLLDNAVDLDTANVL